MWRSTVRLVVVLFSVSLGIGAQVWVCVRNATPTGSIPGAIAIQLMNGFSLFFGDIFPKLMAYLASACGGHARSTCPE